MSYTLEAYAIDIAELKKAVGSKDESLLESIIEGDPDTFDEDDDEFPLSQALRELVEGDDLGADSAHQYGYALKALAAHLGQELELDWWCGVRWAAMEETGLDSVIENSGTPVELPTNPGAFPTIGFVSKEDVASKVSELGDGHLASDDEDLQDLLAEYEGWLRVAAESKRDLLLFYY